MLRSVFLVRSGAGENELHSVISLVTGVLVHRTGERPHRNLSGPRLRVGAGIVDGELIEENVWSGSREAFDPAHFRVRASPPAPFRHGCSKPAAFAVEVDGFDQSVLPSQWPRESPIHCVMFPCGRPS